MEDIGYVIEDVNSLNRKWYNNEPHRIFLNHQDMFGKLVSARIFSDDIYAKSELDRIMNTEKYQPMLKDRKLEVVPVKVSINEYI